LDSRYRITGILGSGGMGCVYLAEHVSIQRPLALKLLHPEVEAIDEVTKRFEREAFAIGRVDHPNCVNVSDFGRLEDGTLYMVLELLDGLLLSELLEREGRVDWRRALHIGRHLLSALACVHEAGIVHRDVKPENVILVQQDGDVDFAKILDFGIAKLYDEAKPHGDDGLHSDDPGLTQVGVTIGTPTYIAPEQAFGRPVDARADLYALSVTLYEMITGAPPFEAEEVVTLLSMHASAEVPAFREIAPDVCVPESVEALIRQGLEKNKEDRMASAAVYVDRIDEIVAREDGSPRALPEPKSGLRQIPALVLGRKGMPRKAIALALTIIGLTAVVLFALGSKGPDYLPRSTRLPLSAPKHGPEAEAAAKMLAQGRPKEAVAYLAERASEVRDDPYAQMVLGHAQASAQRSVLAIAAYRKAVLLEPKLAKDALMRTNIGLMLDKKAPGVVDAALDFMGTLVTEAGDGEAEETLVRLASSSPVLRTRQHAMAVAEEVGVGGRIDRLGSYLLDLEQGETCTDRKDAVAKLRALGDTRAIPSLSKAKERIQTEGLLRRKTNVNACLRADVVEAIRYLESL
jgi:serine/threonine-protein kinase